MNETGAASPVESPPLSRIEPTVTETAHPTRASRLGTTRASRTSISSESNVTGQNGQDVSTSDVLLGSIVYCDSRRASRYSNHDSGILTPVADGAHINVDLDSTSSVPSHYPAVTPGASWRARGADFSASRNAWTEESASPMAQRPATSTPGSRRKPRMPLDLGERPFTSFPAASRRHSSHAVMTPPQSLTVLSSKLPVTPLDPSTSSSDTHPQAYSMPRRRFSAPSAVPGAQAMIVEDIERDHAGDDVTSVPGSANIDHRTK
jgi:hypothetical protein